MLKITLNGRTYNLFWLQCLLLIVFLIMKLADYNSISWFWVFSPWIIPIGFLVFVAIFVITLAKMTGANKMTWYNKRL